MQFVLPDKVNWIIQELANAGFDAYAVGGCVRDRMMGREPQDWDITTAADPYTVKALFRRTVDTGIKHGTVTVLLGEDSFEVTTYRLDGEYEDSRHPKEVTFTKSLEEDLKRRDFTINAMAYNETTGLVDLFGGQEDLNRQLIRCVGSPTERFNEDALRILRALRFSAQLGFTIEAETRQAIVALAPHLSRISVERVREEINKLLLSPCPERMTALAQTGVMAVLFPQLEPFLQDTQNAGRILKELPRLPEEIRQDKHKTLILSWAILISAAAEYDNAPCKTAAGKPEKPVKETLTASDTGNLQRKEFARTLMRNLKFDNDTIDTVGRLVQYSRELPSPEPVAMRRQINRMGEPLFDLWLVLLEGDRFPDGHRVPEELLAATKEAVRVMRLAPYCISLKGLAVTGADLIAEGFTPGAGLGKLLDQLLDQVLEKPERNTKEQLLTLAKLLASEM